MLLVVVVPFLVVMMVMLLWLGRLEVGHWGKALLAKVIFDCPPLHLVLSVMIYNLKSQCYNDVTILTLETTINSSPALKGRSSGS